MAVCALVTSLLCVPLIPIILGAVALSKVSKSQGRLGGGGMALAGLIIGCLHIVLIPMLAGLATPAILRAKKRADQSVTTNNMRNLGVMLHAFEQDWGSYPSGAVLAANPEAFPGVREGESSNALLSMLISGGYIDGEGLFAAPGVSKPRRTPDDVISPPARMLEPGECGMGYVLLQGGRGMSSSDNGSRPLLVTPLDDGQGGPDPRFADRPFNGKAVYLRIDQAVKQNRIDEDGWVQLPDGTGLFETGPGTVWGDDSPDVRGPE